MGYFVRRVTGYFVFLAVLGTLSTLAVNADTTSGGTSLTGTNGAVVGVAILFAALISSWIVRWTMRRRSRMRARLRRTRLG